MDEKKPLERAKNDRSSFLKLALFTRQPRQHQHFQVMESIWVHVMTHHVCNAPFPVVETGEIHEIHSPVVSPVKIIVTSDCDERHANSGKHCHQKAIKLRCQNNADDGCDGKCVSYFLKLFFTQLVSLTSKIKFTSEVFTAFLFTTLS